MSFKPLRDSRPMTERPIAIQLEAQFFKTIQPLLTKKQQGKVMGAFRETLKSFMESTND